MKYHSEEARPQISANSCQELLKPVTSCIHEAGIPQHGWLRRIVNAKL
jgi:hypothetical protein